MGDAMFRIEFDNDDGATWCIYVATLSDAFLFAHEHVGGDEEPTRQEFSDIDHIYYLEGPNGFATIHSR